MEISVRAGAIQGSRRMMRALGYDPMPPLARCGLSAERLAAEDNRVPMQAALKLLAASTEHTAIRFLTDTQYRIAEIAGLASRMSQKS